jgi:hypothetical protein
MSGKKFASVYILIPIVLIVLITACTTSNPEIKQGDNSISGVVSGRNGPEGGVWVIAETFDLPTRFAKIVVTDEKGQYLIPELPAANYKVWVRGYGLIDSPKQDAKPGTELNLESVVAPSDVEAAQYYPAGYWFSLLHLPASDNFPGTGAKANGISPDIKIQADFVRRIKSGTCLACHQLGSKGTRELQASLGKFNNSVDAWERRLQSGQAGANMISPTIQMGREAVLKMFADWTDRIANGEVPQAPPRPDGIERNVVISQWDWADPKVYLHDLVSTDRRKPTVNAYGSLYGALELSGDYLPGSSFPSTSFRWTGILSQTFTYTKIPINKLLRSGHLLSNCYLSNGCICKQELLADFVMILRTVLKLPVQLPHPPDKKGNETKGG